ncbi:hypothetical protein [Mucilaginibacter sp.]|jgi:hypothetical protein|uniref:hypothetical protein n=1 Tax=Mucilaginibacter sp. TaxID=1882438 RepID=UPI002B97F8E4|nr:hypothetical protein [Mucilaginibacter sp.]HTI61105.1 hypothetical protein [Mucilaginibacter sp.]
MRRTIVYVVAIPLLLLVVTNPGLREFKSYLHESRGNEIAGRDANFFVFSLYSNIGDHIDAPRNTHMIKFRYLGILGNFFPIGSENVF